MARTALTIDGEAKAESQVLAQMAKHFEAALLRGGPQSPRGRRR